MGDYMCCIENYGWYQPLIWVAVVLFVIFIILIIKNYRTYLSFAFIPKWTWLLGALGVLTIVGELFLIPKIVNCPPPSKDIAIVLGNTANTPKPKLTNDVSEQIKQTMLLHKGESVDEWSDSLIFISAVKHPDVIKLDNEQNLKMKLKSIGTNPSNAERNASENINSISEHFSDLQPKENGANYLEAIFEAKNNVEEGANIVVIGSGLSDSGALDFAHDEILTSESAREEAIQAIKDKYEDYLSGYNVIFYGLGDTVSPQEALSNRQKEIVRDIYKQVVRELGGTVKAETKDIGDDSIKTNYVVSTTDTGCGQIGLIFDNDSIKFVANQAEYVDIQAAKTALSQIKTIYDKYTTSIKSIQIDGYIAHYGNGQAESLSGERASKIKRTLIDLGIPENIINATGKGFGPYNEPEKDRMVKITIVRQSEDCEN